MFIFQAFLLFITFPDVNLLNRGNALGKKSQYQYWFTCNREYLEYNHASCVAFENTFSPSFTSMCCSSLYIFCSFPSVQLHPIDLWVTTFRFLCGWGCTLSRRPCMNLIYDCYKCSELFHLRSWGGTEGKAKNKNVWEGVHAKKKNKTCGEGPAKNK